MEIKKLTDLNRAKSAPVLTRSQIKKLLGELDPKILNADWITVGIMAFTDQEAIGSLKSISRRYTNIKFNITESLKASGSVFLKGNQKTGNVFIRSENGLGEGILLTCQYEENSSESSTYGPLPLDFFLNLT